MNFLDRLGCEKNRDVLSGKLFTGEVVTEGFSDAPKHGKYGAWRAKLRSVIVQLTCAYRLGRSANLLEAYYALATVEVELLISHHRHWKVNVKYGLDNLDSWQRGKPVPPKTT